jgi:hypothetical protein
MRIKTKNKLSPAAGFMTRQGDKMQNALWDKGEDGLESGSMGISDMMFLLICFALIVPENSMLF